jgi:hypothetical protein
MAIFAVGLAPLLKIKKKNIFFSFSSFYSETWSSNQ